MNDSSYVIRNYCPQDLEGLLELNALTHHPDRTNPNILTEIISQRLGRPGFCPAKDLFIAEEQGRVVACLEVISEPKIRRIILEGLVHPTHHRQELSSQLMQCALKRATEMKAEVVHVKLSKPDDVAARFLCQMGFEKTRCHLEMQRKLTDINPASDASYRHLAHGEEAILADIQNRCFIDSWGYSPNTSQTVSYELGLPHCCPDDVIVLPLGETIVGYCWTQIESAPTPTTGTGRIHMIGVVPEHRGKGLGKAVLLAGLKYLKKKGCTEVVLTVDSQNTAAYALYGTMGFTVANQSDWYQKRLGL